MTPTTALETSLLAELIRRKRDCLVELRDLGPRQLALVREVNMTTLLDVLSVKQRLLGELQKLERQLDPFRGQDPDARRWPTPEARQQTARRLAECEALLTQIVRQDEQSEEELIRRRRQTAIQLQGVHAAQRARGAYLAPGCDAAGRLDLSSER
jgi:hypothetical protein